MSIRVSLRAIYFEQFQLAFNLASGITKADEGKAVTLDSSAANTVKLAGDGDVVFGRLEVVEDREQEGSLVGTIAVKFSDRLPVKTGETIAIGDTVVGAGDGEVKARVDAEDEKAPDPHANQVVEVDSGFVTVLKI